MTISIQANRTPKAADAADQPAAADAGATTNTAAAPPAVAQPLKGDDMLARFARLFQLLQARDAEPGSAAPAAALPDADTAATDTADSEDDAAPDAEAQLPGMSAPILSLFFNAMPPPVLQAQQAIGDDAGNRDRAHALEATARAGLLASGVGLSVPPAPGQQLPLPLPLPDAGAAHPAAPTTVLPTVAAAATDGAADAATPERTVPTAGTAAPAPAWQAPELAGNTTAIGGAIKLNGPPSQWQQPLRQALGEQLQVQVERNSEHAVLRLSPPMLGRIEISIRHEAGALQVHMSASNGDVLRQLQGIGDSLRHDLSQRQYNDVAVVVSAPQRQADSDGRQRHGQPLPDDDTPGRALGDAGQGDAAYAQLKDRE